MQNLQKIGDEPKKNMKNEGKEKGKEGGRKDRHESSDYFYRFHRITDT